MKYIESRQLVNANDQQYINVGEDEALLAAVLAKNEELPDFLKRQDTLNRIRTNMQEWYELQTAKSEIVRK